MLGNVLDDLVNRRHDVAHGVNKDQILGIPVLMDVIDKIQEYFLLFFQGINLSLNFKKLNIECNKFLINNVYPRESVIAFKAKNIQIFTEQKISIIPKSSGDIVEVKILGIHKKLKNGKIKQCKSAKVTSEAEISLKLDLIEFQRNDEVYIRKYSPTGLSNLV